VSKTYRFCCFDIEEWQPRATVGMDHAMVVYECIPTNAIDECTDTLLNYARAANQRYWFQIQRPVVVARDDSELQWNISSNQMERDNISLTCSWQPMSTHGNQWAPMALTLPNPNQRSSKRYEHRSTTPCLKLSLRSHMVSPKKQSIEHWHTARQFMIEEFSWGDVSSLCKETPMKHSQLPNE